MFNLSFLCVPYRKGKIHFRTLSPSLRKRCNRHSFTLSGCLVPCFPFSSLLSPPVSDSTECLLSFLLHLETGHPSSPSAGTPARRPELPLAPFPRAVPGMLLGCALGAPSLQLMPDSSRCCSRGVDLIAGSLLRNTGRRGNAMVLSWWLPLVQVQNMMQGQDPVRCGPPPHASASRFCRLLHSAPEAVALRRDPAHASPCQHGGPA